MKPDYREYTVSISNEPSYYGTDCNHEDARRIVKNLSDMIRNEFPGIQVRDHYDGRGSGKTTGPDEETIEDIDHWIEDNWMAAL